MPRIPQIMLDSVPQGELSVPKASPSEFGIGKGLASLGEGLTKGADAVYKSQELQEKSQVAVQLSQAKADYTNYLVDMLKNGDVDTDKFQQKLQDHLGQIGENLSTPGAQSLFAEHSSTIASELQIKAYKEASALAGERAKSNYTDMINNYSSQAELSPSDFHSNIAAVHSYLDSNLGDLGEKNVLTLKQKSQEKIAQSAAKGMIDMDPVQAEKDIKSGMFNEYLDGTDIAKLVKQSQVQQRTNFEDHKRQERAAKDAVRQQQMLTSNDIYDQIYQGTATFNGIQKADLEPTQKEHLISIFRRELNQKSKGDPAAFNSVYMKIHADDGDSDKVYNEAQIDRMVSDGKLSVPQGIKLRREIQNMRLPDGQKESDARKAVVSIARKTLVSGNPMMGIKDPQGEIQLQKFTNWMLSEIDRGKKAGIPTEQMFDPNDKHYLGKGIRNFVRSSDQIMESLTESMHGKPAAVPDYTTPSMIGANPNAPPPPPSPTALKRLPDETPAQYLARRKKASQ